MRLGLIVLRLRSTTELFSGRVGGVAEYAFARENTLDKEMAFVIPIQESAPVNESDNTIQQKLVEQFGVIVSVKNDTSYKDKTGFTAYNALHDMRADIFKAYLGYDAQNFIDPSDTCTASSIIYYRGGQLLDFDRSYLWYQFTFEYWVTLTSDAVQDEFANLQTYLDKIYAQYELMESDNIPISEALPVKLFVPDMEQLVMVDRTIEEPPGITWTSRSSAADSVWVSVAYGNGLFVAVGLTGTGVMTSSDGINWTSRAASNNNLWHNITYGNGLFVAVSQTGAGDRVMTSPDGINWTSRVSAADNEWRSVTYGNGLFVAVASSGVGDRVMTSPDGINWTSRVSAVDNYWYSVTYGNGLFVAVALQGAGDRVMTSPDGINWTSRVSAADNEWRSVTYGNGLFVAVASTGAGGQVMTSPDGTTWTSRTAASANFWHSVVYGNGLFVAVSYLGTINRVMTSPDGITWTGRIVPAANGWLGVTYGNGLFVAVANTGVGNRVMTSG
jgi:hypothetical protein